MRNTAYLHEQNGVLSPDDPRWIHYISTHPDACIFHHPNWINSVAECYGYHPSIITLSNPEGSIVAGLPIMEISQPLLRRRLVSLPFSDHCVPLLKQGQYLDPLLGKLTQSEYRGNAEVEIRWDFSTNPTFRTDSQHVMHCIPLSSNFDDNVAWIHSMHRRNTGMARKKGVQVKMGTDAEFVKAFYRLHIQTRRRQGSPVQPLRFFELIRKNILEKGLGFILLAYHEGKCLAGAVFIHFQRTLTYKYGASILEGLSYRPNDLIFWTAIQWGCENGFTRLDLGRTDLDNHGLREFKSRWGAQEVPLTYSYFPSGPKQGGINRLMPFMQVMIRNSPMWVCLLTGKLLYRYAK